MSTSNGSSNPQNFEDIFAIEQEEICLSRQNRLEDGNDADKRNADDKDADDLQLMGLALSGGGIRSATFGLGILQALAEQGLLKYFDYLSTVSGGGYIGSWLTAWIMRESEQEKGGISKVQDDLKQSVSAANGAEIPQIRFLREYSNYLTPQTGFFSGDTWTSITTYARNFFVTFLILVLAFAAVLLVPRMFILLSPNLPDATGSLYKGVLSPSFAFFSLLFVVLLYSAMRRIGPNLVSTINQNKKAIEDDKTSIQMRVVLPLAINAGLAIAIWLSLGGIQGNIPAGWCWVVGTVLYPSLCLLLPQGFWGKNGDRAFFSSVFAGLVGGLLLWSLAKCSVNAAAVLVITWGPPAMILVGLITVTIHVAFIGRYLGAEVHEWLLRLGGWLSIYTFGWITLFLFALYSPILFYIMENKWIQSGIGLGWIGSTIAGILAGRSAQTGPKTGKSLLDWIATVTPFIFIVGLLGLISLGLHELISDDSTKECFKKLAGNLGSDNSCEAWGVYWKSISDSGWTAFWLLMLSLFLLGIFSKVDINLFSLHYYYRNRLIRCYLGASRSASSSGGRNPNPFTGFDGQDDHPLIETWKRTGPYHIINTALNLVSGKNLAWQQRKASSFVFTPKAYGFETDPDDIQEQKNSDQSNRDQNKQEQGGQNPKQSDPVNNSKKGGYVVVEEESDTTQESAGKSYKPKLGEAFAISGAAFSPNMGYHSSPAASFLLAIFNVRLGYWFSNPVKKAHQESNPISAWLGNLDFASLPYLIYELLGWTNSDRDFVYLSDGGHFENLGIYELVRRRCRYIVAVDAGQDGEFGFEDLGNAIRKCKVDLNTDIRINTAALKPKPDTKRSDRHCVVGIIHYPATAESLHGRRGYLLYVKPSLSGDEPMDVLEYAGSHPAFPHESTVDQWFSESQFESYRKLGYHTGKETLKTVMERELANRKEDSNNEKESERLDMEGIFAALRQFWFPPSPIGKEVFIKHGQALNDLMEQLRITEQLSFLDAQVNPAWKSMMDTFECADDKNVSVVSPLKVSEEQGRGGFYFCNAMIQLAENVYSDLNLEDNWEHPDNRGWVNLFRHWASSDMMRKTWAISAPTFGARFQVFCQERFGYPKQTKVVLGAPIKIQFSNINEALEDVKNKKNKGLLDDINEIEIGLIEAILIHPSNTFDGKVSSITVIPFQIGVPSLAGRANGGQGPNHDEILHFGFGFALLVGDKIGYFRVQNHLRKAGLGRKALAELLKSYPVLLPRKSPNPNDPDYELLEVPPGAFEVPTDKDKERFRTLYRSVSFTVAKTEPKPQVSSSS